MTMDYEAIRQKNIKEYGEGTRHLSYFADIYSTRTHFLYEVLQNAEDALARRPNNRPTGYVHFHLHDDRLEIRHNGAPFTERDVSGICGIGEGTKAGDFTQIGKFGIGFKSVYAYTFYPQIHSGGDHFRICRFVEPHAVASISEAETLIVLPFDQPDKRPAWAFRADVPAKSAVQEIGNAIKKLGIRTMLFLRHIGEIKWTLPDGKSGHFIRSVETLPGHEDARKVEVLDHVGSTEEWQIFQQCCAVQDAGKAHDVTVEAAYLVKAGDVTRASDTELVVYFPTEKKTELGFLIQAPFKTTKARDNIKSDDPANRQMIEALAKLTASSLEKLRDLGLLSVASYNALPLRGQDFPVGSLFRPIYDKVREAFQTQRLLPAHGGGFVCASKAKLARGKELVELFSPEQLGTLFGKEKLAWLDSSITESGSAANLHTYLIGKKISSWSNEWELEPLKEGIEVTPQDIASKLMPYFFGQQSIEWLIRFVIYASNGSQEIKRTPLVRLIDGKHVAVPSDTSAKRPAWFVPKKADYFDLSEFPLIHPNLADNEGVRKFLEKEGIREIDAAAIVERAILPQYKGRNTVFDETNYREHLRQIRKAYAESNDSTKQQLKTSLNNAAWVACVHASGNDPDKIVWRRADATDVFARTADHESWFLGLDSVGAYFLHPSVNDELNSFASSLVKPATVLTQNLHPSEYTAQLSSCYGKHKQGLNGFKPDATVIGLQAALDSWNTERASILWNIMLSAPRIISGETQSESNRQRLDAAPKNLEYTEVGNLCRDRAWLPDRNGEWRKPSELFLSDLPDGFDTTSIRAKEVADKLGMKRPVSSETIDALGFKDEEELRRAQAIVQSPDEFREFEEFKRRRQEEGNSEPALPDKTSPAPQRREVKIAEEARNTPEKTQETRERTVDPDYSGAQGDARTYLKHQYTNKEGAMFCQLCQAPQPVMLNSEPHFEAVDCVDGINAHHKQNKLALCPNHAAMYKNGGLTPDTVQIAIWECDGQRIPLNLAGNQVELYFTQQHLGDLRAALTSKHQQPAEIAPLE